VQPFDATQATHYATVILSAGVLVASVEDLALMRVFARGGVLDWGILELQNRLTAGGWTGRWAARVFGRRGMAVTAAVRGLAAGVMVAGLPGKAVAALMLGAIYLCLLSLTLRSPYGLDGAHQMYRICVGALFLCQVVTPDSVAARACLYFIGVQAVLSYLVSGGSKLVSPSWRSGSAMIGIFSASLYGNRSFFNVLHAAPWLARLLSWTVIMFECSMVVAPFVGARGCLILLASGVLFHVANAILMGLNGFVFAFVGTYPCVYLLARDLGARSPW